MGRVEPEILDENIDEGIEFVNLKSLFGEVLVTGETLIANDPASDPRRGGLPPGHPALNAFMGMPIHRGDRLVGMIGIANRPGGYDTTKSASSCNRSPRPVARSSKRSASRRRDSPLRTAWTLPCAARTSRSGSGMSASAR